LAIVFLLVAVTEAAYTPITGYVKVFSLFTEPIQEAITRQLNPCFYSPMLHCKGISSELRLEGAY